MRLLLALLTALSSLTPAFAADPRNHPGQRGDAPRRDVPRRETPRVPQTPREMPRREQPRREEPRREQPRVPQVPRDTPRREEPRREQPRVPQVPRDTPRREEPRREQPRVPQVPRDTPRREEPRREQPRVPQVPRDTPRREEPRREEPRREQPRVPQVPREQPRREQPRREEPRREIPRRHDPRRRGPVIRPVPEQPRQPGQPGQPGGVRRRLPRPERITDRTRVIDIDRTQIIRHPDRDGLGRRLGHTHLGRAPHRHEHTTIINNNITIVNDYSRRYTTRGGWWWHDHNGYRLGHHCDTRGRHWFGWYIGTVYFWTVWHGNYYWHWDPYYERWVYWNQNRWWYEHPTTRVVYVYDDRRYYRYDEVGGGVVTRPDTTPPVAQPPAEPGDADPADASYFSEDGTREVRIYGDERDAFLYDTAETPSFEPKFLASGAKEVQFSDTSDGTPLQINVVIEKKTVENGVETVTTTFKLFDASGERVGLPAPPAPADAPDAAKTDSYRQLESGTPGW